MDPIFKFDRNTGEILANFGAGTFVTPHGIYADGEGNVWVTDFAGNDEGTKGHQVHKFSPTGELLLSLGIAGQPGNGPDHLNQPIDVIIAPDGSIFVADGHTGQNLTTDEQMAEARAAGLTGRIVKYSPDGEYIMEWGEIGTDHGQFRTPHALEFDAQGRLWVADRGNHRLEIFDQEGNYLDSRYQYGRISDLFITEDEMVYAIDSESNRLRHINWRERRPHRTCRSGRARRLHSAVGVRQPAEPWRDGRGRGSGRGRQRLRGRGTGPRSAMRALRSRSMWWPVCKLGRALSACRSIMPLSPGTGFGHYDMTCRRRPQRLPGASTARVSANNHQSFRRPVSAEHETEGRRYRGLARLGVILMGSVSET